MDSVQTPIEPILDAQADIAQNKDIAAFSYIWIMSIAIFALKRNSPFVRRHSRQGIALFLLSIPLWFVPFIGNFLVLIIVVPMMVFGFLKALEGEEVRLPVIARLIEGTLSWKECKESLQKVFVALKTLAAELLSRVRKEKLIETTLDKDPSHL